MKRKYRLVNKRRFVSVILSLALVLTATVILVDAQYECSADETVKWTQITVDEGDTLWELASLSSYQKENMQQKVQEIMDYNNMDSVLIRAGSKLYLPGELSLGHHRYQVSIRH